MGKGFAAVASDVKDLAPEAARSTVDIPLRRGDPVRHRQRGRRDRGDRAIGAIGEIGEIGRIIARLNDCQLTIASAVEEQTATTSEMSRDIGDATPGATNIGGNIAGGADAAQSTTCTLAEADQTVTGAEPPGRRAADRGGPLADLTPARHPH